MSELTKFRVHFSDGHSIEVVARNPEEAKSAGTFQYPGRKVMKVKRVREAA